MKVNVVSLMPEMVEQGLQFGVVGAAFKKEICKLNTLNPRQFTEDVHQTVDDRPFGGGDGMLMLAEPLQKALESLSPQGPVFFLSPQGKKFDDAMAKKLAQESEVTFICGRYGGIDHMFLQKNKIQEVSIGDYILSGGELAALVMIDSITRQIPGVLGHVASATEDTFHNNLLEVPYFTRPQLWQGVGVPPLLLSGDHKKMTEFKRHVALVTTLLKRPDLLAGKQWPWVEAAKYFAEVEQKNLTPMGLEKTEVLKAIKERIK